MMDDEVAELQQECARLRRRLSLAGVVELPPADLPSAEEADRLLAMVTGAYPKLRCPDDGLPTFKAQFRNALSWLAFVYRTDKLATQYAPTFWCDAYREWATRQGFADTSMGLRPFAAACIASGIAYTSPSDYPYMSFGLSLGGAGRPSAAWRSVLENGLAPPTEPKRPRPRGIEQRIDASPRW